VTLTQGETPLMRQEIEQPRTEPTLENPSMTSMIEPDLLLAEHTKTLVGDAMVALTTRASTTTEASERGKGPMLPSFMGTTSGDANNPSAESDDGVEEIEGHPRDGHQHVYVCRHRGDHWACHEEIAEVEEADRVERAAKCLITKVKVSHARTKLDINLLVINSIATCKLNVYVQDVMKTTKYQKWCFD